MIRVHNKNQRLLVKMLFLWLSLSSSFARGSEAAPFYILQTSSSEPKKMAVSTSCEGSYRLTSKSQASRYILEPTPDGRVCLKDLEHHQYLSARNNRRDVSYEPHCLAWESFTIEQVNDHSVAFKSYHGTYLRANFGTDKIDQAEKRLNWERFQLLEAVNINAFGSEAMFIPLPRLHKRQRTQSWIYMPLILASLKNLGVAHDTHLPDASVASSRAQFEAAIPGFFKFMTDFISYNISKQLSDHLTMTFVDNTLTIGSHTFVFDSPQHMRGADQERFLNTFSNSYDTQIAEFLLSYPQPAREEFLWAQDSQGFSGQACPEQLVHSLLETATSCGTDFPASDAPYLTAVLNTIIIAVTF